MAEDFMLVRSLRIAPFTLTVAAAAMCTQAQDKPDTAVKQIPLLGKPGCFYLRSFNDWTVLDESNLLVHASLEKNGYQVKLFQSVSGLKFHVALGFEDVEHTGRICDASRDYLLVRDYTPPRIPVVVVHELTMDEQVQLLKAAGKTVSHTMAEAAAKQK
jgi:hypothetical protein